MVPLAARGSICDFVSFCASFGEVEGLAEHFLNVGLSLLGDGELAFGGGGVCGESVLLAFELLDGDGVGVEGLESLSRSWSRRTNRRRWREASRSLTVRIPARAVVSRSRISMA